MVHFGTCLSSAVHSQQVRLEASQSIYTVVQKTGPLHYCNKIFFKSLNVQPFNVKMLTEEVLQSLLQKNVQNGVPFHGHKPGDVISIRQSILFAQTFCD